MKKNSKSLALLSLMCCFGVFLAGCTGGSSTGSGADSAGVSSAVSEVPLVPEVTSPVHEVGRISSRYVLQDGAVCLDWTNAYVEIRFLGQSLSVSLSCAESESDYTAYVRAFIDGAEDQTFTVGAIKTYQTPESLDYGEHTVRLVRLTEAHNASLLIQDATVRSGDNAKGAAFLEAEPAPVRKIEFIGDSITAGFGNTGTSGRYVSAEQDGLKTYAALLAEHFDAEGHFVAISGRGVYVNNGGSKDGTLSEVFTYASPVTQRVWDTQQWQPDLVVINAGTNDVTGGASSAQLKEAAVTLLQQVHAAYPKAKILWTYGMMRQNLSQSLSDAVETFRQESGADVRFALMQPASGQELGAVGHPNEAAHRRFADALIPEITALTGWE